MSETPTAHYPAGSEDMPWLCHWAPKHTTADLHMLAAEIVSTCPSLIPRCPMSSLVIVWSRQSFISSVSGSVGLGQIWAWTGLSGSLGTHYHLSVGPFSLTETGTAANNKHSLKSTSASLNKTAFLLYGAAEIKFIYMKVSLTMTHFISSVVDLNSINRMKIEMFYFCLTSV